ncbi:sulfurtransferase complex subunit TusB [uncultured Kushneria sp.]|uniref:sulfurtransferase complex subunit TusB n=1 Tax=uncultured Kushneria sp. TaxID=905033 RepID=UPI002617322A|nr:sulfurtransferase complex subunit TusB [uncultured Kushneria sp.]
MSTLHLINRSPFSTNILQELADAVSQGDHVLLVEDGVYAASGTLLHALPKGIELWALEEDCMSRGVTSSDTSKMVDMAGFVALTATTHRTVSWF